ncbi:long-chain fatty acid--CoA ligase [Solihabitans fulvus]|uniref:Acyl-CoA synthetase n=1 Tax=Solihabitans fulvus TaxID=1892852 RepID=A0A5B2XFN2_9PSEU|nr:long-chain fatty acid--CoA ligase [Solihabitans fulvus]KAA2261720.1 long-chain fatty acid--CoA ligase [Solihabitans fulvus]
MEQCESPLPLTLAELPRHAAERFADRTAARHKADGQWVDVRYDRLADEATAIAAGLLALGLQLGDRVCVLAETRYEWLPVELGIASAGGVTVPIYPSSSPEECAWVLADSQAIAVVCETAAQVAKVEAVRGQLPDLAHVFVIEPAGADVPTVEQLRARGAELDHDAVAERTALVRAEDPALIVYTSGTTGPSKGCVLSNSNVMANVDINRMLGIPQRDDVVYVFLPLAHIYGQGASLSPLGVGAAAVFCSAGVTAIVPDLMETSPTVLPSVPRVFEKIYAAVSAQVPAEQIGPLVRVGLAVRDADRVGAEVDAGTRAVFDKAEAELFGNIRNVFGGRLRVAVSGAAPIAQEILEFFNAAGVPVVEGWGMSETTASGTINRLDDQRFGTIGKPVPGSDIRIAEDGELLIRGRQVFQGYWRNQEATDEVLVDGWLHTGDLAAIDDEGYATIVGRKKDIIITAGGKNIAPANLENDLRQSPWVSQVVIYGDRRPYLVAVITLDAERLLPWAREQGLPEDLAALSGEPRVRELVQAAVDAANSRYARAGQIKKFVLLDRDLTQDAGEVTPTMKLRRSVVHRMHADALGALYENTEN